MKHIYSVFLNFIKRHKIWSVVIGVIIVIVFFYSTFGHKTEVKNDFATVELGTIREEVSVTGNVKPLSNVDLAFEKGGRVININVAVGDRVYSGQVLGSVSNSDLLASLDQAKASLKKVTAEFGNKANQANLDLVQSRSLVVNAIKDSYTKSDDAIRNKFYSIFNDAIRYNAKLAFSTDPSLQDDLEDGRNIVNDKLDTWYRSLVSLQDSSNLESFYNEARGNLDYIKVLLDKAAEAVNGLNPGTDSTQTQIDTWKSNISTARTNINASIDSLTTYFNQYKNASLSLEISKNSTLAEEASIEQARAQVASAEAELSKSIIYSPISGLITDIPVKIGEIVPANQKAFSVISYGDYEVESFVPEADISKIKIGNMASTTLDAYGSDVNFSTEVIKIDPAATVIDGVPTYKITLRFVGQDDRIRSGMTANLDILTAEKTNVLVIPARAVYSKEDGRYTKVLNPDNLATERSIQIGLRGFDGKVEVVSGLELGEKVSTTL